MNQSRVLTREQRMALRQVEKNYLKILVEGGNLDNEILNLHEERTRAESGDGVFPGEKDARLLGALTRLEMENKIPPVKDRIAEAEATMRRPRRENPIM